MTETSETILIINPGRFEELIGRASLFIEGLNQDKIHQPRSVIYPASLQDTLGVMLANYQADTIGIGQGPLNIYSRRMIADTNAFVVTPRLDETAANIVIAVREIAKVGVIVLSDDENTIADRATKYGINGIGMHLLQDVKNSTFFWERTKLQQK